MDFTMNYLLHIGHSFDILQQFYYCVIICIYHKLHHRYYSTTVNAVHKPTITALSVIKSNTITAVLPR